MPVLPGREAVVRTVGSEVGPIYRAKAGEAGEMLPATRLKPLWEASGALRSCREARRVRDADRDTC